MGKLQTSSWLDQRVTVGAHLGYSFDRGIAKPTAGPNFNPGLRNNLRQRLVAFSRTGQHYTGSDNTTRAVRLTAHGVSLPRFDWLPVPTSDIVRDKKVTCLLTAGSAVF